MARSFKQLVHLRLASALIIIRHENIYLPLKLDEELSAKKV